MVDIDLTVMDDALAQLITIEAEQLPFIQSRWLCRGWTVQQLEQRIAASPLLTTIYERALLRLTDRPNRYEWVREWEREYNIDDPDYVRERLEAHRMRVAMFGHSELVALYDRDAGNCSLDSTVASEDRITSRLFLAQARRRLIVEHRAEAMVLDGVKHLGRAKWREYDHDEVRLVVRSRRPDARLVCVIKPFCNQGWEWLVWDGPHILVDGYAPDLEDAKAATIEEVVVVLVCRGLDEGYGGRDDPAPLDPAPPSPTLLVQ